MKISNAILKYTAALKTLLADKDKLDLPAMPAAAEALTLLALHKAAPQTILWIHDSTENLETAHKNLTALIEKNKPTVAYFPPSEANNDPEIEGYRLKVLQQLSKLSPHQPFNPQQCKALGRVHPQQCEALGRAAISPATMRSFELGNHQLPPSTHQPSTINHQLIIVTCIQALQQSVPSPDALKTSSIIFDLNTDVDLDAVTTQLQKCGYSFEAEVQEKSQAALKGGILDVWSPTNEYPTRIELFGPTVESIRIFDPTTQRSIEKCHTATIPPLTATDDKCQKHTILDHLPKQTTLVWSEPGSIAATASELQQAGKVREEIRSQRSEGGGQRAINSNIQQPTLNTQHPNHLKSNPVHPVHPCEYSPASHAVDAEREGGNPVPCPQPPEPSPLFSQIFINPDRPVEMPTTFPIFTPLKNSIETNQNVTDVDQSAKKRNQLIDNLNDKACRRHNIEMFCNTKGSLKHIKETLLPSCHNSINVHLGELSDGLECPQLKLIVVAESDLYGKRKTLNRRYAPYLSTNIKHKNSGRRISDFTDMEPGDMVVHIQHGIGRYIGIQKITFNDQQQEVLAIQYADDAKLYVPMSQAHLLSRYVGLNSRKAHLHKLGGKRWSNDKEKAQEAVLDLAADLLEVQAARNLLEGHSFSSDNLLQHEFATAFPFQETEDQIKVIIDVKADMQSTRPMDRLICGDAGYGKTEVAMRAAFKAVQNQHQVAMLVPTTILAQQHFRTFTERMAGFSVTIEVISRFCTAKERKQIIQGAKDGTIDIIIGTHALVSPDISFANLGLVIIDEEQRFGVRHKEHLKHMRKLVDVLTLSATPIPRTLYMSMTGARDMSLLQTPPRERMAIETIVATADDHIIRKAVLRELSRNGQIYYLHNRVMTIHNLEKRLTKLLPEASIKVAHGQMKSKELSDVMQRFTAGEFDLLLCTTIIESGMDIPRANTILIDRADRFGIADLYQLRGRVGRSNHKAYAYLLLPPHGHIDNIARERIHAIRKHSDLGAGFNLAVRDMEIRGAGNILGSAQSGHIAAVGFGIYCQLLKRSIAKLKGEKPPPLIDTELRLDFINLTPPTVPPPTLPAKAWGNPRRPSASGEASALQPRGLPQAEAAYIPLAYISNERIRIATYRRIAEATEQKDITALKKELKDRFGKIPPIVKRLMTIASIRITAATNHIQLVEVRNNKIIIRHDNKYIKPSTRFPTLTASTPDKKLKELKIYIKTNLQFPKD